MTRARSGPCAAGHVVAFVLDTGDHRCARCGEAVPVKSRRAVRFRPAASLVALRERLQRQADVHTHVTNELKRWHG